MSATPTRFIRVAEQVSADLGGEAAILQMGSGAYYGLNPVAARVWQLLAQPVTVDEIVTRLTAEYAVDEPTARQDVEALLRRMQEERLVTTEAP